jgi:hypothetical protein
MKTLLRLLIGLCMMACIASANAELSSVAFAVGKQQFKPGDSIVIEQVLATSPKLSVGDKIVVRGHYQLASAPRAKLGLFVTHRTKAHADNTAKSQMAPVETVSGSFELSCEIRYEGDMHVSFYPVSDRESFGGVYFTTSPRSE